MITFGTGGKQKMKFKNTEKIM